MANNGFGTASGVKTFADTKQTIGVETIVVPSIITQSDQIALYFSDDLEELIRRTHIDLVKEFQIPDDYSHDPRDIINMLYEDISHMLRDGMITGIHLLLSDNIVDRGEDAYLVRYHVRYAISNPNNSFATATTTASGTRFGGLIAPPPKIWRDARFALLIDWSEDSKGRRHMVRRPNYCFDWMPKEERFDATNVICYREGGLAVDSAKVILRTEAATPKNQEEFF